jgi:hypothetical protein
MKKFYRVLSVAALLAVLGFIAPSTASAQLAGDKLIIEASSAKVATSAGNTAQNWLLRTGDATFQLDVTAAATEAGDTLDVFIQTTIDGTNWIDVVHFTQVVGNGGAKRHIAKIDNTQPQAMFENGTALAAGSVRNIAGTAWRARWAIVDATTVGNVSFTFSVNAVGGLTSLGK